MKRHQISAFVGVLLMASALGCYEHCAATFSSALMSAQNTGNNSAQMSCQALLSHIECLRQLDDSVCNETTARTVQSSIVSTQASHANSCQQGAQSPDPVNCGAQYVLCNEQFNQTFASAMNAYNIVSACLSIKNYTSCVEQLIRTPDCSQYANHAINAVNSIKSRHASLCPESTTGDDNMARCMNETMECYTSFNNSFYPSMQKSNMTLMCSSVVNYSNCVQMIASDAACQPYTVQAVNSIQVLRQQHQAACGEDGGKMATECLIKFKECYQHFNDTFNPAMQSMDIHKLCGSMDEYKACAVTIPSGCRRYLGQSIEGLNRMQAQYSQYCTAENKKIFACSQLSQCNRDLIGNLTLSGAESGMLCMVLESYFPCVDEAVSECMLSGDGVTAVSFSDLGMISSRYCRSVLTNPSIKNCVSFMQCHAALDLNRISPTMMVEGTYWCHYMDSSLMCSSRLISARQCSVQNSESMLDTIGHLQQLTRSTCTAPPASTTSKLESATSKPDTTETPAVAVPAEKEREDEHLQGGQGHDHSHHAGIGREPPTDDASRTTDVSKLSLNILNILVVCAWTLAR